ncbi:terminase small subunit [Microbacterium phage BAjuniper]|nr:terminase small subunit [Microbacterium phage BAjuniper]
MTLLAKFDAAAQSNTHLETVDDALIEAGRSIAKAIDDITADPEASATEKTKALYLTPHLVSILRELLATPAARKQFGLAAAESKKASRLELMKNAAKAAQSQE